MSLAHCSLVLLSCKINSLVQIHRPRPERCWACGVFCAASPHSFPISTAGFLPPACTLPSSWQEAEADPQSSPELNPSAGIRPLVWSPSPSCPREHLCHFVTEHQSAVCAPQPSCELLEDRSTDGTMLDEDHVLRPEQTEKRLLEDQVSRADWNTVKSQAH